MGSNKLVVITDGNTGTVICKQGILANTFLTRLVGLLGRRSLEADAALLIKPSSGVHTFGMFFPIDIVSLDQKHCVIGISEDVGAWRIRGLGFKTRSVLELPAGQIRKCGIQLGHQLIFEACSTATGSLA
jgi:uncharacterized protein